VHKEIKDQSKWRSRMLLFGTEYFLPSHLLSEIIKIVYAAF